MIPKPALQNLLMECYEALGHDVMVDAPQGFIEQLSDKIFLATAEHPLPRYQALKASPEACDIFKVMIQESAKIRSAQLTRLTANVQSEIAHLKTTNNRPPNQLNIFLKQFLALNLIAFGDHRPLKAETEIDLNVFIAGLNQSFSSEQLDVFEKAFSWFFSRYERKLRDKEISPNTSLYNDLAKISLALYSTQCVSEIAQESGPVHMIHFYESTTPAGRGYLPARPRAGEYLDTYDSDEEPNLKFSFDKTSHGLGSGVYSLGAVNQDQINKQVDTQRSNFKIFEIEHPLRLMNSSNESEKLTEISKDMQRICDKITVQRHAFKHEKSRFMPGASRLDMVDAFFLFLKIIST